jgi:serine/threonine protein kinase
VSRWTDCSGCRWRCCASLSWSLRLVYNEIKPTNILVNRTTGELKLTGFGTGSPLPRERQAPAPPESIGGSHADVKEFTARRTCSHKIEFISLNANLMVSAGHRLISSTSRQMI